MKRVFTIFMLAFFFVPNAFSANQVVNLEVAYKTVYYTGKARKAIAVNHQIPAPTLHFKAGDHVTINVHNKLDKKTVIHWHGILVPWQADGVEGITQKGIPPGGVFSYQFKLHQAGTYWYHAHAGLQEQQGLYGAFLIDPPKAPPYKYTKDYVVVLSDWSNTHPDKILSHLKKEGSYYSSQFPLQPSLVKFFHDYRKANQDERKQLVDDYKMMQQMRMSIYDISDVAFDAFLLNGQPKTSPWRAPVKIGDVVRLRFIGAGGSTIFHVKIPGTPMQMVHAQGNDVKPYMLNDFTIAPGETYDVLVKIQKNEPYIIYAESMDTVGAAYGALLTSPQQKMNYQDVKTFPEPLPVTREMMSMMGHHMSAHHKMNMDMPTESTTVGDKILATTSSYKTTPGTKYEKMIATVKTNDPTKPVEGVINMELFGYMDRFIWFINGLPEYKAHPIVLKPGKRYRFVFKNTSMMHHPMHIHGHWFILRKGQGAYDPLLHTIDVAPGATMTADVDTDASGQWFFHCHLLYHMVSGMSRVFQYNTLLDITQKNAQAQHIEQQTQFRNRPIVRIDKTRPIDQSLVKHPMAHATELWFANYLDIGVDPFNNAQRISFKGLYGKDYHKLELFINDAEIIKASVENADVDIFYWHLLNQFWAIKGGVNYVYRPSSSPSWQVGIGVEGLLPYFIDLHMRGYSDGSSAKLDVELSRDTQITNNFFIRLGVRGIAATHSGLSEMRYMLRPYYRLMPGLDFFSEYEHERKSTVQNTLTFGLAALF